MSEKTNNDFTFTISVSQQGFETKPTENSQVSTITFIPTEVNIAGALQYATEGRAFCYSFSTANSDGKITMKDKKEANFQSTSTVIYDFDDMEVPMLEFIAPLPYKPTFAYPTYSDGKNGYSRYRLAYVFDSPICGTTNFNRINQAIATANAFVMETRNQGGWDKRNVAQFYLGTTPRVETYNSNIVYSFDDFAPFIDYTIDYSKKERKVTGTKETDYTKYETTIEADFLKDFKNLPQVVLFAKYKEVYYPNYAPSLETPLILDDSDMFYTYPDDYVCVNHKCKGKFTYKFGIGEDRKKKMYVTAQVMLFNQPNLSIENLLYNLSIERQWYYENSDNKLSNECLIQTAINAFTKPFALEPSKHRAFRLNKSYWAGLGVTANQAKNIVQRILRTRKVQEHINPELTVEENMKMLKEHGIETSTKTLKRMAARGDIKVTVSASSTPSALWCSSDTLELVKYIYQGYSQSQIAQKMNKSLPTIKRHVKSVKGTMIYKVDGEWLLMPPFDKLIDQ